MKLIVANYTGPRLIQYRKINKSLIIYKSNAKDVGFTCYCKSNNITAASSSGHYNNITAASSSGHYNNKNFIATIGSSASSSGLVTSLRNNLNLVENLKVKFIIIKKIFLTKINNKNLLKKLIQIKLISLTLRIMIVIAASHFIFCFLLIYFSPDLYSSWAWSWYSEVLTALIPLFSLVINIFFKLFEFIQYNLNINLSALNIIIKNFSLFILEPALVSSTTTEVTEVQTSKENSSLIALVVSVDQEYSLEQQEDVANTEDKSINTLDSVSSAPSASGNAEILNESRKELDPETYKKDIMEYIRQKSLFTAVLFDALNANTSDRSSAYSLEKGTYNVLNKNPYFNFELAKLTYQSETYFQDMTERRDLITSYYKNLSEAYPNCNWKSEHDFVTEIPKNFNGPTAYKNIYSKMLIEYDKAGERYWETSDICDRALKLHELRVAALEAKGIYLHLEYPVKDSPNTSPSPSPSPSNNSNSNILFFLLSLSTKPYYNIKNFYKNNPYLKLLKIDWDILILSFNKKNKLNISFFLANLVNSIFPILILLYFVFNFLFFFVWLLMSSVG